MRATRSCDARRRAAPPRAGGRAVRAAPGRCTAMRHGGYVSIGFLEDIKEHLPDALGNLGMDNSDTHSPCDQFANVDRLGMFFSNVIKQETTYL
jgi:hypothetical protein